MFKHIHTCTFDTTLLFDGLRLTYGTYIYISTSTLPLPCEAVAILDVPRRSRTPFPLCVCIGIYGYACRRRVLLFVVFGVGG